MSSKPKVISIVGPTASGKTSLSIEIAKHFNGEVISADSRQVYEGLDIGSGKVTTAEMDGTAHHLLDVVEPMTIYTGADFKHDATLALEDILERNKFPVIAGGTFFYVELLKGSMQTAPVEPDYDYREGLDQLSNQELFELLKEKDTRRAENIDSDNRVRLIRSLEIIKTLGHVPELSKVESPYEWLTLGIDILKEQLHENISKRLAERFSDGMIDEVKDLLNSGVTHKRLEELGLEYRYISLYLKGEITETQMKETLETKIRQFAKRQMTWLKRDMTIEWVKLENRKAIFQRVENFLNN